MPKIAIYTMAKNEVDHVARFAETTRGADVVVVTDTGSTDGTPDLLRDAGIEVHSARVVPWRFDVGTNVALAHVPDDVDVCVKLDLDEVLFTTDGSPWRDEIERLWQPGGGQVGRPAHSAGRPTRGGDRVNRLRYWYTWSWHVPGKVPAVRFRTENIHGRSGFVWRHPGHAALCCNDPGGRMAVTDTLEIHHYMKPKQRPNYLPLLELAVKENRCPRTIYYLGRECFYRQANQRAIELLEEYLAHPAANWNAERADALRMIGVCWQRLAFSKGTGVDCRNGSDGASHNRLPSPLKSPLNTTDPELNRALSYLMQAIAEFPGARDLWFELLRFFHDCGDWQGGYWAGCRCLAITERNEQYVGHSGDAWNELPFVLTAQCALQSGRKDEAVALARQAIAMNPASELARRVGETM